ncbi:Mur ligase family protein [Salegentibacter sediminis]|uniref:Mur ligase family protein n=1 Tax=Salegentibacter sediminis TaxID=1930251 RepID=UPI0009C02B42|nr:Mur ligase family protein [Salegentibacter sediminis]
MNLHFIAIGGSAMHKLAIALQNIGYQINGSDDAISGPSKMALEKHQLYPKELGWFPEKIDTNLDAVVLGEKVQADNPELKLAEELGLNIYSYSQLLFEVTRDKTRVVIAGSQSKNTLTAMVHHVMQYHGKEVDYMLETQVSGFDNTLNLTKENDFIVIEGDETFVSSIDHRPKFHLYQPNIALLSGIARENINDFSTLENYVDQFKVFINSIVNGGILVYNEADEKVKELAENTENPIRKHPYSIPEYHIEDDTFILDTPEGEMPLEISGEHNMNNLAGAKWICQHMGIDEDDFYEAIIDFKAAVR